eukprot:m.213297 g.213297  ORF g.213297 m.213297 type:complete len:220 (+) comp39784_c0_seq47:232-891(+)
MGAKQSADSQATETPHSSESITSGPHLGPPIPLDESSGASPVTARSRLSHRQYAMSMGRRRVLIPSSTTQSRSLFTASFVYMGSSDSGIGGSFDPTEERHFSFAAGPSSLPNIHFGDVKCPMCSKSLARHLMEDHLTSCLSRPYISYNGAVVVLVLSSKHGRVMFVEDSPVTDLGECIICFEDMTVGCKIARLPCLCVYHKTCIDKWFNVNRCCPEHPL